MVRLRVALGVARLLRPDANAHTNIQPISMRRPGASVRVCFVSECRRRAFPAPRVYATTPPQCHPATEANPEQPSTPQQRDIAQALATCHRAETYTSKQTVQRNGPVPRSSLDFAERLRNVALFGDGLPHSNLRGSIYFHHGLLPVRKSVSGHGERTTLPSTSLQCARASGKGAGPRTTAPVGAYCEPWHGHMYLFAARFHGTTQPRWVQTALSA